MCYFCVPLHRLSRAWQKTLITKCNPQELQVSGVWCALLALPGAGVFLLLFLHKSRGLLRLVSNPALHRPAALCGALCTRAASLGATGRPQAKPASDSRRPGTDTAARLLAKAVSMPRQRPGPLESRRARLGSGRGGPGHSQPSALTWRCPALRLRRRPFRSGAGWCCWRASRCGAAARREWSEPCVPPRGERASEGGEEEERGARKAPRRRRARAGAGCMGATAGEGSGRRGPWRICLGEAGAPGPREVRGAQSSCSESEPRAGLPPDGTSCPAAWAEFAFRRCCLPRVGESPGQAGEKSSEVVWWLPATGASLSLAVPDGAYQALPKVQDFRERFHNAEEM